MSFLFSKESLPILDHQELLLWTNPSDSKTLIFIAYNLVHDDYTSLGSFGTVDQVAAKTIMPKGLLMGLEDNLNASMLSSVSKNKPIFLTTSIPYCNKAQYIFVPFSPCRWHRGCLGDHQLKHQKHVTMHDATVSSDTFQPDGFMTETTHQISQDTAESMATLDQNLSAWNLTITRTSSPQLN